MEFCLSSCKNITTRDSCHIFETGMLSISNLVYRLDVTSASLRVID